MNSLLESMFQAGMYKKTQGMKVRQGTAYAIAIIFAVAAYQTSVVLSNTQWGSGSVAYLLSGLLFAFGAWFAYRIINWPRFADFLSSVEAEMNKVSWPTRSELIRSSLVVLVVLFILAIALFLFDVVWTIIIENGYKLLDYLFR